MIIAGGDLGDYWYQKSVHGKTKYHTTHYTWELTTHIKEHDSGSRYIYLQFAEVNLQVIVDVAEIRATRCGRWAATEIDH